MAEFESLDRARCWSDVDGTRNLRYEQSDRIHAARTYPVKAPNGSTVIIYAQDAGLRIVWRGGRPYRHLSDRHASLSRPQINGNAHDDHDTHMDEAEDEPPADQVDDFEDEEEEKDPSAPYDTIIDSYSHAMNSPALHIAFAPLPTTLRAEDGHEVGAYNDADMPRLFRREIVVAVACKDSSIHILSIPLIPSPPHDNGEDWGEHTCRSVIVSDATRTTSLRRLPRDIAMTWTIDPTSNSSRDVSEDHDWMLLLAGTTSEGRGTLKLHGVPFSSVGKQGYFQPERPSVLRSEHLSSQALTIAFKPSSHPAGQHTQLLIADMKGAVRLYDPFPAVTSGSGLSERGRFLATFLVPFETTDHGTTERQRILSVAWAASGACIIVLLANAQWGVWDLEGAGPNAQPGLLRGMSGGNSISGSATTPFTLRGYIGSMPNNPTERLAKASDTEGEREPSTFAAQTSKNEALATTRLAPMTPNTRKSKQGRLFSQEVERAAPVAPFASVVQGGISVTSVPNRNTQSSSEDSIVIWYQQNVFSIPSLKAYWERAAKKSVPAGNARSDPNVDGVLFGTKFCPISRISTGGQSIVSISQILSPKSTSTGLAGSLSQETLIATEHRLMFVKPPAVVEAEDVERNLGRLFEAPRSQRQNAEARQSQANHTDQDLLARGELDLGGMDRLLNGMQNGVQGMEDPFMMSGALKPGPRRVGFAAE